MQQLDNSAIDSLWNYDFARLHRRTHVVALSLVFVSTTIIQKPSASQGQISNHISAVIGHDTNQDRPDEMQMHHCQASRSQPTNHIDPLTWTQAEHIIPCLIKVGTYPGTVHVPVTCLANLVI